MIGAVVMLAVAGLLEGYARQLIVSTPIRYAIALTTAGLGLLFLSQAPGMSAPDQRVREMVTPKASTCCIVASAEASERASAFLLDVGIILGALIAMTLVIVMLAFIPGFLPGEYLGALWLLGFFFLRVFYFTAFEITPRAATPGKRIMGLRGPARRQCADGGFRFFARNAMRELESSLPISFFVTQIDGVDNWISIAGLIWAAVFLFFPLFNKDRLRIGDIVAGTWVVHAPKRVLGADLAAAPAAAIAFTREARWTPTASANCRCWRTCCASRTPRP